ncbi:hypothetical protein T12_3165 [Trichinella patagoniensis]|uniref:Uncharacterized protein n=1 Tax=Trichinella patagoniensis TaxID=990121 RepID=A0A0V0ZTZ8_9BILA|nr:hypothetical protein T12_3165 [Trichinella patagoniensis]
MLLIPNRSVCFNCVLNASVHFPQAYGSHFDAFDTIQCNVCLFLLIFFGCELHWSKRCVFVLLCYMLSLICLLSPVLPVQHDWLSDSNSIIVN